MDRTLSDPLMFDESSGTTSPSFPQEEFGISISEQLLNSSQVHANGVKGTSTQSLDTVKSLPVSKRRNSDLQRRNSDLQSDERQC